MSPIISPWAFYFIGVGAQVQILSGIIAFVFVAIFLIYLLSDLKFRKGIIIIAVLFGLLTVFIPSKETCYQMVAASICTPDNIDAVVDGGKTLVDYIIESVSEVEEIERETKDREYSSRR